MTFFRRRLERFHRMLSRTNNKSVLSELSLKRIDLLQKSRRDFMTIAQRFIAGNMFDSEAVVPEGRLNKSSVVPPGQDILLVSTQRFIAGLLSTSSLPGRLLQEV